MRADLTNSGCTGVVAGPAEMMVPVAAYRYAVWLVKKRSAWRKNGPKWPKNATTSDGRFVPNQQLPGPLTHVSQAPMMSADGASRPCSLLSPQASGVGPFLKNIAENSNFATSARPTFAVTQRTHPLRCRPSKLDSPLDGVENGQNPAGLVASSRHPGPVRASARGVFSRNSKKVG